jgi:hypothetical protein
MVDLQLERSFRHDPEIRLCFMVQSGLSFVRLASEVEEDEVSRLPESIIINEFLKT